jgi:hypothetical protein
MKVYNSAQVPTVIRSFVGRVLSVDIRMVMPKESELAPLVNIKKIQLNYEIPGILNIRSVGFVLVDVDDSNVVIVRQNVIGRFARELPRFSGLYEGILVVPYNQSHLLNN